MNINIALPEALHRDLKIEAARLSERHGRRVTLKELIIDILETGSADGLADEPEEATP